MRLRTAMRACLMVLTLSAAFTMAGLVRGTVSGPRAAAGSAALLLVLSAVPVAVLRWLAPPTSAMMVVTRRRLARAGCAHGRLAFDWVPLEAISTDMCLAAIAAEDAYFRDHSGFDWESIRDARAHNRTHEQKRGASTITQQVAKNLFLWPARSWLRKGLEAWLTLLIEALWPKRRILEVYLNIAQLGPDVFGVQAAARRFFGKPARDITQSEAALLAAALPNPAQYEVGRPSHRLRFRQSFVLSSMRRLGDGYLEHI